MLLLTVVQPNIDNRVYKQEFASIDACEAARRSMQGEMERLIDRANAAKFNQSSPSGYTDAWSRYHPSYDRAPIERDRPDMMIACAPHAVAGGMERAIPVLPADMFSR